MAAAREEKGPRVGWMEGRMAVVFEAVGLSEVRGLGEREVATPAVELAAAMAAAAVVAMEAAAVAGAEDGAAEWRAGAQ